MSKKVSRAKRKKLKREGIYQPSLFERRRGGQPGNTNAVKHGLYSAKFSPDELESLSGMREGLQDEIDLMRVNISRLMTYCKELHDIEKQLKPEEYIALHNVIAKEAATVARLMQVNKALNDAQNVGVHAQLLAALEEVNASLAMQ
jgi:hypothetical protein